MLEKEAIDALAGASNITDSIILKYPETVAVSDAQDIMMAINIKDRSSEFEPIALYQSFGRFLNLLKMFGENTIGIQGNILTVKNDQGMTANVVVSNPALMTSFDKSTEQFDRTEQTNSVAEFVLTADNLKKIHTASSLFSYADSVSFIAKDNELKVKVGSEDSMNSSTSSDSLVLDTTADVLTKEFKVSIPLENFNMLPVATYKVFIKYNSVKNKYRVLMKNLDCEGIRIILAVKI